MSDENKSHVKATTQAKLYVPSNRDWLAAFGEVAILHEHLNYILRMTVKTLSDSRPHEAIELTEEDGYKGLRRRVRKLGRERLGEGTEALRKLDALLQRCQSLTCKRNEFIHSVLAEVEEEPQRLSKGVRHAPPTLDELAALARDIDALTAELNLARKVGFLAGALAKKVDEPGKP